VRNLAQICVQPGIDLCVTWHRFVRNLAQICAQPGTDLCATWRFRTEHEFIVRTSRKSLTRETPCLNRVSSDFQNKDFAFTTGVHILNLFQFKLLNIHVIDCDQKLDDTCTTLIGLAQKQRPWTQLCSMLSI
jgi:hypothetical protein